MYLRGQERRLVTGGRGPAFAAEAARAGWFGEAGLGPAGRTPNAGYAMAALLVAIAVLTVMLSVAMPVWRHEMQREREAELVFRGEQYIRAIGLFQRKYAGALPPNIDVLVNERFLRKKYKDPLTEDGEFRIVAAGSQLEGQPGQPGQQGRGGAGQRQPPLTATVQPPMPTLGQRTPGQQPQPGIAAGIIGVASKSKEKSIRIYKGRNKYDEWPFIFANIGPRPGQPGQGQPQPGGPGGLPRPGQPRPGQPGRPGPGDPLRPSTPGTDRPVVKPGGPGSTSRPPG